MYIINTTFIVEPPVHGQWYDLFLQKFVPFVRGAGFDELVFTRVLADNGDAHYTYSLQVGVADLGDYQRFLQDVMGEYNAIAGPLFGEQALYFTSLLKRIEI